MIRSPTDADLDRLAELAGVPAEPPEARYLSEPRDRYRGRAAAVLRPRTVDAIARVVGFAQAAGVGLIPYAGGTGLVGGQLAEEGPLPVVLSLERLDRIRAVSPEDGTMTVEAGVVLADVQAAAAEVGRLFPLSIAAEGTARIGGCLATNAGGVQVLRYGNARDLALGIEAVLPDGRVHHGLKRLRKDNTGYDLRHLLIGSEGTLGVITAAVLKLFPQPAETVTAMIAVPDPAGAVALLHALRDRLGDGVSAFELMSGQGFAFLGELFPERRDPLESRPDWRVLVEIGAPPGTDLAGRAEAALAEAFEAGLATDGTVAASEAQRAELWWFRETMPEANRRIGAIASHDISLPLGRISSFIADADRLLARLAPDIRVNCFGHAGDGNLHYNLFPPAGAKKGSHGHRRDGLTAQLHALCDAHEGSVSAEHGIGRAKRGDLQRYGDPAKLAAMSAIKTALDPAGVMNPGAVLPSDPTVGAAAC